MYEPKRCASCDSLQHYSGLSRILGELLCRGCREMYREALLAAVDRAYYGRLESEY